jgi:hypothetical protein
MKRLLLLLVTAITAAAQNQYKADRAMVQAARPAVLWRAPGNISMENWTCGSAGCDHVPAPPFQFLKEDTEGTFPKLMVKDAKGRTWSVKFGGKAIPESFCSRFVTAMGYLVEPSYFVARGKLEHVERLHRARSFVKPDGAMRRARFQLRDPKELDFVKGGAWSLADNPFRGTHEFAGLRVLLMLLSNWDAKDSRQGEEEANTAIFRVPGAQPEFEYSFFDWGSSLGRWGHLMRRTRSDCSGFADDTRNFITGVQGNVVGFGYSGKHEEDVKAGITVDDLRWLVPYLGRITDEEIRAGLTASGATPRQTTCWAESLRNRIQQVQAVARTGRYWR